MAQNKSKETNTEKVSAPATPVSTYTTDEIARSKKFRKDIDIVRAVLDDKKRYSVAEVEKAVASFKATVVKEV